MKTMETIEMCGNYSKLLKQWETIEKQKWAFLILS